MFGHTKPDNRFLANRLTLEWWFWMAFLVPIALCFSAKIVWDLNEFCMQFVIGRCYTHIIANAPKEFLVIGAQIGWSLMIERVALNCINSRLTSHRLIGVADCRRVYAPANVYVIDCGVAYRWRIARNRFGRALGAIICFRLIFWIV